jgi:hypothetical protein
LVYELNSFVIKAKTRKTKINFRGEAPVTTISLQEEGACISEKWLVNYDKGKGKKGKSDPATCRGGAWGERRYSSYSFLTSALDGGEW